MTTQHMMSMWQRQNLAYQDLHEIPDELVQRNGSITQELDLTHNHVSDLKFLMDYPQLTTLILDHNNITSHVKIPTVPRLQTLWVNHNNIKNLSTFVGTLAKHCPNLKILSMMNNEAAPSYFNGGTFQQYMDYRYYVISKLSKLEALDDKIIEDNERSEAQRIYGRSNPKPRKKSIQKSKKSSENQAT